MRPRAFAPGLLLALASPLAARAATLSVGPGKTYAAPCAAIAAAADGDVIEVDAAGSYDGDVCGWSKNGLTIRGVGGRAKIDAAGQNAQGKAIWVIAGDDTIIEDIELSGATVPDQNGAGIRQEGKNLTIRRCSFHDNEDGILAGDSAGSEILIEYSEFDNNGFGDGYSHNMYINHVAKFTLQYSWSHRAKIGHLVKSRAAENHILYNRLTGEDGTESYELDLPNGGLSFVIGNLFHQGGATDNPGMLAYQAEGPNANNPSDALFVVNNTFDNGKGSGTFVSVGGSVTTPAVLINNVFAGGGTVTNQGSAVQTTNFSSGDPVLVDAASFDYHPQAGSPLVDAGTDPGMGGGQSLAPTHHYVHPTSDEGRMSVGTIDIGAYELGGGFGGGGTGAGGSGGSAAGGNGSGANGTGASGSGASGSGANGTGASGSGGNAAAGESDDGGCGCRVAGAEPDADADASPAGLVAAAAAAIVAATRRRRRAR